MNIQSYRAGRVAAYNRELNIQSDPIAVMLTRDSYVPNLDTDKVANIEPHEIVVGGYEAQLLIGQKLIQRGSYNYLVAEAPEWRFDQVTDVCYAVAFAMGGPPIALVTFDENLHVPHLRIEWDERGILRI